MPAASHCEAHGARPAPRCLDRIAGGRRTNHRVTVSGDPQVRRFARLLSTMSVDVPPDTPRAAYPGPLRGVRGIRERENPADRGPTGFRS